MDEILDPGFALHRSCSQLSLHMLLQVAADHDNTHVDADIRANADADDNADAHTNTNVDVVASAP